MTLEQIVAETRHWSSEQIGELVGRLTKDLHGNDPQVEAAWLAEVDQRVEEIQAGRV